MKTSKAPLTLVFYGAPASGKSTQALLIGETLNAAILMMGAVLRKLAKGKSALAKKVAVKVNSGQMVSAELTLEIISEFISHNRNRVILFEGVPRTLSQAKALLKLMKDSDREILFVLISLTKAESLKRMKARSLKEQRADDGDREAIQKRFDIFKEESQKLLELFKDHKLVIPGDGTVKQVTARILKGIKAYDAANNSN